MRPAATARRRPATSTRRSSYARRREHPEIALHRDARRRRRARLERLPAPVRRPARGTTDARVRADDQGGAGRAGRPVQQPRVDLLPRPDARAERRERRLPVRVGRRLAARGARGRSATSRPGTSSRTCSPASRRCAAAGAGSTCPIVGAVAAALARGRPERLQAARHLGARHGAADALGQPARPRPSPAGAVPRAALFYFSSFTVPIYLVSLAGALLGFVPLDAGTLGLRRPRAAARRCDRALAARAQPARSTTGAASSARGTASSGRCARCGSGSHRCS